MTHDVIIIVQYSVFCSSQRPDNSQKNVTLCNITFYAQHWKSAQRDANITRWLQ